MTNAVRSSLKSSALSRRYTRKGKVVCLRRNRLSGVFEVGIGGRGCFVRRVPDQAGESDQQQHDGGAHRGPEKPRRLALDFELPPEFVGVVHVLECTNRPSHTEAARAPASAAIHAPENRVSKNAARRSNAGRARRKTSHTRSSSAASS